MFIDDPSLVALISGSTGKPTYFVMIQEKVIRRGMLGYCYRHNVLDG